MMDIDAATATIRLTAEEQARFAADLSYAFWLNHKLNNLYDDTRKIVLVRDAESNALLTVDGKTFASMPLTEVRRLYLHGRVDWDEYQTYERTLTVQFGAASSALAAAILEDHLKRGGSVEIPSLGITQGDTRMLDLEAIKAREAAATPGPWWVQGPVKTHDGAYRDAFVAFGTQGDLSDTFDLMERYDVDTDYQFIAHAREDIPALLTEVARLARIEATAQTMRTALAACADDLEAYINAEYRGMLDYPHNQVKLGRDMEPVIRARAAMALLDAPDA